MRVVILGTGGHARSLRQVLGGETVLTSRNEDVLPDDVVHIGVGDMTIRRRLFNRFKTQIPDNGLQVMAHTHIGPDVWFGENVLVNTGAQIDHDCRIGAHAIIAPGVILCGNVAVGAGSFIGAGAIIVQGVKLEPKTCIQAGALVVGQNDIRAPIRVLRPDGTMSASARAPGSRQQWDHEQRAWR